MHTTHKLADSVGELYREQRFYRLEKILIRDTKKRRKFKIGFLVAQVQIKTHVRLGQ